MTKLEELKAAWDDAYEAALAAYAAYAGRDAAAWDARDAYQAELKKAKEQTNGGTK